MPQAQVVHGQHRVAALVAGSAGSEENLEPDCYATAQTQLDLNRCAAASWSSAEKQMEAVYPAVLERHKQNQLFVDRLERSQDAWKAYRQAHPEAIYPNESRDQNSWGSIHAMCSSTVMEGKARQRIAELRQWLEKRPDVCGGTRPSSS